MKITLLGTNGWYDTETGNTTCVLVQASHYDIIFDAGYGFTKIDQYPIGHHPAYLFLSHFHLDHLIGLHTLPKFHFDQGLTILGQTGTTQVLLGLLDSPYSIPLSRHHFPVQITDLPEGKADLPFGLTNLPLIHSGPCIGYRLEIDGHVIAYCTDTGYCENAIRLAEGADLLITECSQAPGSKANTDWPHLSPAIAAQIASEAHVHQLALIHFDPTNYPTLADRAAAQAEARMGFANTTAGQDGMVFELA
jgi:ribonuclease BN (tRNA processing enzyme)